MRRATSTRTIRSEQALGLVEAVVAAFVLLIVGVAISTILVSTTRTQAKVSLSERRLAAAEGLFERLKADSEWAGPAGAGCSSMPLTGPQRFAKPCSAAWLRSRFSSDGLVDQTSTDRPIRYEVRYTVRGIDDPLDGQLGADQDGMRPDYYLATVGVRRSGSTDTWTELSGTIDPPGRRASGAITINVCQVRRQYDERIPVASCPNAQEVLLGYPTGGVAQALGPCVFRTVAPSTHGHYDWCAALPLAGPGGGGLGWQMVSYDVVPASGVQLELRRADGGSVRAPGFVAPAGCSSPSSTVVRCRTSASTPIRRIPALTPGQYRVRLSSIPSGYDAWPLHSIPAGDTAIVESGRVSRVLQVIKPVDRPSYTVSLRSCDHSEVMSWGRGPCVNNIQPSGISGYLAPAASARAHWSINGSFFASGAASVGAGASQITFTNLVPGLYSGRIVTTGQSSLPLTEGAAGPRLDKIWLNPARDGLPTGDVPASTVPTYTRHWCDYDRRVAYLAGVGLPSSGGRIPYTYNRYDRYGNVIGTATGYYVYYSADRYCPKGGSSGGGPPGPGAGGA